MSGSKPPEGKPPEKKPEEQPETGPKSGRVTFDSRGNAVWEWSMSTGAFGREVDTKRLERLEAKDLKIAEEPPKPTAKGGIPAKKERGSDPYNSSGEGVSHQRKSPAAPQKPTDLRRLSEWIKQQKALGKKVGKE